MLMWPTTDSRHTITSFILRTPIFEQGIDRHISMLVIMGIVVLGIVSSWHGSGIKLIPGLNLVIRPVSCMLPAQTPLTVVH